MKKHYWSFRCWLGLTAANNLLVLFALILSSFKYCVMRMGKINIYQLFINVILCLLDELISQFNLICISISLIKKGRARGNRFFRRR